MVHTVTLGIYMGGVGDTDGGRSGKGHGSRDKVGATDR